MSSTRFYNVTVVCEGPVNGTWVRVVLAARHAVSPESALSFLRHQARRIADGLDPDPGAGWIPPGTLIPVRAPDPDVPTALRAWCHTPQAQKAARDRLLAGAEFALDADDFSGRYTLRALPVPVPAYVLPRHAPRPGRRRHRKPRWFDRFRLRFPFRRRAGNHMRPDDAARAVRAALVISSTHAAYAVAGWLWAEPFMR